MGLVEKLQDFAGSVGSAATNAPDEYAEWSSLTYELNVADIRELWAEIRPLLKRDLETAALIDRNLEEGFAAFDVGRRDDGRKAMWTIYNIGLGNLR